MAGCGGYIYPIWVSQYNIIIIIIDNVYWNIDDIENNYSLYYTYIDY